MDLRQPFLSGVVPEDNLKTVDMGQGPAIHETNFIFVMVERLHAGPALSEEMRLIELIPFSR